MRDRRSQDFTGSCCPSPAATPRSPSQPPESSQSGCPVTTGPHHLLHPGAALADHHLPQGGLAVLLSRGAGGRDDVAHTAAHRPQATHLMEPAPVGGKVPCHELLPPGDTRARMEAAQGWHRTATAPEGNPHALPQRTGPRGPGGQGTVQPKDSTAQARGGVICPLLAILQTHQNPAQVGHVVHS